jgi:phosphoribosylformimino-5-aminoimidazole carboxamide ribotide isomerase
MLIPSIDLLGGQVVQLEQGERVRYANRDIDAWVERFSAFPIVQLIDLDAARGTGDNRSLVVDIARRLPCQIGGGIRTPAAAAALIESGALRVIIGSALFTHTGVNGPQAEEFGRIVGASHLVAAVDARGPSVVVGGWRTTLPIGPVEAMHALEESVGAFLYTDVSREGLLGGFDLVAVDPIRRATARRLIVAGGIRSVQEIDDLHQMGIDAVVGMAIYTQSFPLTSDF